jgi:hypothetical protein
MESSPRTYGNLREFASSQSMGNSTTSSQITPTIDRKTIMVSGVVTNSLVNNIRIKVEKLEKKERK